MRISSMVALAVTVALTAGCTDSSNCRQFKANWPCDDCGTEAHLSINTDPDRSGGPPAKRPCKSASTAPHFCMTWGVWLKNPTATEFPLWDGHGHVHYFSVAEESKVSLVHAGHALVAHPQCQANIIVTVLHAEGDRSDVVLRYDYESTNLNLTLAWPDNMN
jgi:hypothetical protein